MVLTFVKRAVSPVRFETAPAPPEEVLCPGSEEENSDDEHVQKRRRRIEALGTQYLEGKGLFIQSAGLKGPFNQGWMNPWAKSTGLYANGQGALGVISETDTKREPATLKRRSVVRDEESTTQFRRGYGVLRGSEADFFKEPAAKRMKNVRSEREELRLASKQALQVHQKAWLKGNLAAVAARVDGRKMSPTPTPAARERVKIPTKNLPKSEQLPHQDFTPINGHTRLWDPGQQPRPAGLNQEQTYGSQTRLFGKQEKSHKPSRSRSEVKPGLSYSQRVSSQPLSQESPKRLAPYVSSIIVDQASSGKLISKQKNLSRPSPHTVPPSTNLPEFQYRYATNGSASTSDRSVAFVDAPESLAKRPRSNSGSSTSSSGSSAFAEAVNAAQAKVDSAAQISSYASMSKVESGVKAQAKKLSYTASGRPKVHTCLPSSRSEVNTIDPALLNNSGSGKRSEQSSAKATSLSKESSKLSDKPLTNGNQSREVLPEAQSEPNAPAPLVPSGPSTNLLETEKQSQKLENFEEDSYMNLSTQAAILKAQRSFQSDVLDKLINNAEELKKPKGARLTAMQDGNRTTTPLKTGHRYQTGNQKYSDHFAPKSEAKEELLSTQAMIDDLSPFAITTIKKKPASLKKRASFAASPTRTRNTAATALPSPLSPGTPPIALSAKNPPSFSPSPPPPQLATTRASFSRQNTATKPPSSGLTSFSILPNGTFTETQLQQDGQQPQQQHPPPPTFSEQGWGGVSLPADTFGMGESWRKTEEDLEEVLEEAESFLGDAWDLETEARKGGVERDGGGSVEKKVLAGGSK